MPKSEVFVCQDCSKEFHALGRYHQHRKTHLKPSKCEYCQKGFGLPSDLDRHIKARHRIGNPRYSCGISGCATNVSRKDNIRKHLKKYHPEEYKASRVIKSQHSSCKSRDNTSESAPLPLSTAPQVAFDWWQSASSGNLAAMETILKTGFDVDSQAGDGNTALHCSAHTGQTAIIRYLLGTSAQLDLKNKRGETALFEAAVGGNSDCILILLHAGASVQNFRPSWAAPRLCFVDYVVRLGDAALVERIIEMDTPQIETGHLSKAYAFAVAAAKLGHNHILKSVIDIDAGVLSHQGKRHEPPLYFAVRRGNLDTVQMLASLERSIASGTRIAATFGQLEILKFLLAHDPSVNDISRRSVLVYYAAWRGHLRVVEHLLSYQDSIDNYESCRLYKYALSSAKERGYTEIVRLLVEYGVPDFDSTSHNQRADPTNSEANADPVITEDDPELRNGYSLDSDLEELADSYVDEHAYSHGTAALDVQRNQAKQDCELPGLQQDWQAAEREL